MSAPLQTEDVTVRFGGLVAVDEVSLRIDRGELVALVGPNGAGKSTLFNAVTGHVRPSSGRVLFDGDDITTRAPHERARAGLVRTWQIARPFHRMTVLENVMSAAYDAPGTNMARALIGGYVEDEVRQAARDRIEYVGLDHMEDELAGTLSGGQRKLLELARGMMLEPRLMLLDEPFAGVNPTLGNTIMDILLELQRDGMTMFLVEHNMEIVMAHCPRVVVMTQGSVLIDGTPDEVQNDQRVIDAYLGGTM